MIFSCTRKVLNKIEKYKIIGASKKEVDLHNWYVDSMIIERKNYFLFTNSLTLFSFFEYVGTKNELLNLENIFRERLELQLVKELTSMDKKIEKVIPKKCQFAYVRTNSRSVLGSMNEFKNHIQAHLEIDGGLNSYKMQKNYFLNEMIMGALKYEKPKGRMKKVLELT